VLHHLHAEAPALRRWQTSPIVGNLKLEDAANLGQPYGHLGGFGVLDDIVHRLLGDAVQMGRRRAVLQDDRGGAVEAAVQAPNGSYVLDELGQADSKRVGIVADRHKAAGEKPGLRNGLAQHLAHPLQSLCELRELPGCVLLQRRADKLDRGELLSQAVVEVLPYPPALPFRDLNHLPLKAPALGLRGGQRTIALHHLKRPPDDPRQQVE